MEQRTALITGVSGIIGAQMVHSFLEEGYFVYGIDKKPPEFSHENFLFLKRDLQNPQEILTACQEVKHLDCLINNAAIADPFNQEIGKVKLESWQKILDINLTAPFLLADFLSSKLRKRKGSIVNIASTRALMSEPCNEAYAACKGGLIALTHALMNSLQGEVNVNCVSPGWIVPRDSNLSEREEKQHPSGRAGRPSDVGRLCLYLVSKEAEFINGQNIVIDGGMVKKMIYV